MIRHYKTRMMHMADLSPIPQSERSRSPYTVAYGQRFVNGKVTIDRHVDCMAVETVCPYLVVHQGESRGRNGNMPSVIEYVITHVPTGYYMMRGLPSESVAVLCAGVLSQIFPWRLEDSGYSVRERINKLPDNLQRWVRNWVNL